MVEDLSRRLVTQALELGFDLAGIAAAAPVPGAGRLLGWLEAGYHGSMAYMESTASLRTDPRRVLPGCRSVVAVAMTYHTSRPPSREALAAHPGTVWISRYAWGRDYHRILKKRLVRLGRWLAEEVPGAGWRAFVDTGPVLEREWAARAGLGWIGKNGCLINRRFGSELFLGVLLTTAALEPSQPASAHCGRCTACLDACPANAFPEPGLVDGRRCVAALTVEHRGPVEPPLRAAIGRMIAGCDICQEVCPWNRRAPADLHPEFLPAPHRYLPALEAMESLDEALWREWRRGSPLGRIPWQELRRNLAIARKNMEKENGGASAPRGMVRSPDSS